MKNSEYILKQRYINKDADGVELEDGDGVFWRVATFLGDTHEERLEYYELMKNKDMLPNSPTLANAGIPDGGCLSACFVVSPDDNTDSIFETLRHAAHIVKSGGGVGFGFSKLRHYGDAIKTVHKKALGPINVMEIYSVALNKLTQGGSFREAALMGQLHISHPDIVDFIHCKDDRESLSNFNISVQVTDKFMNAVKNDEDWDLISPRTGEVVNTVRAKWLWNEIVTSAHLSGDPGLSFYDMVQKTHPNDNLGPINGSNPCGEQNLEDFGSCNLASINLGNFVTKSGSWDYIGLSNAVHSTVRMLNKVIDKNTFPLQELEDMNLLTRRIGLGVMGWADALVRLGVSYDSERALMEAKHISDYISKEAWKESEILAKIHGPFPNYYNSKHARRGLSPTRNSCVTSVAPTGTISRVAECSFSVEPFFDTAWESNILWSDKTSTPIYDCPIVIRERIENYFNYDEELVEDFIKGLVYGLKNLKEIGVSDENIYLYRTAHDIAPEWHIKMQAAWQSNISNSISKTISLPNSATVEDVSESYFLAWEENCKGITIYRSGTREVEVLNSHRYDDIIVTEDISNEFIRPPIMHGFTKKVSTGHGSFYVTMNYDENGKVKEVIANMGKSGACNNASLEVISRIISVSLQHEVPMEAIIKQLEGITCCPTWSNGVLVRSPYDGLADALIESTLDVVDVIETKEVPYYEDWWMPQIDIKDFYGKLCPDCNTYSVRDISGCPTCMNCTYSKCG